MPESGNKSNLDRRFVEGGLTGILIGFILTVGVMEVKAHYRTSADLRSDSNYCAYVLHQVPSENVSSFRDLIIGPRTGYTCERIDEEYGIHLQP